MGIMSTAPHLSHCQNEMSMICFAHKIDMHQKHYPEIFNLSSKTLGNEGLQPPLPMQGQPEEQKPYYGWQYDQDQPDPSGQQQQAPIIPPQPDNPPQQQFPVDPNPQQAQEIQQQMSQQYQQPVQDMGTSLGYGQGMEYQYVNTPQPSQPLPQLRQARLQQLREDRMRRQQRRMQPDSPSFFARLRARQPSH